MPRSPGQRQGRTRKSGTGKAPKQYRRLAVSYSFKQEVIAFYDEPNTMAATVKQFFPQLPLAKQRVKKRQIYAWLKQRDFIVSQCKFGAASHCNARAFGAGATLSVEIEEHIVHWIYSLRSEGIPVTGNMVRTKAKEISLLMDLPVGCFQASHAWLLAFLRRHRLSIRRRTHEGQKTPANAADVATKFAAEVLQRMQNLGIDKIYNADQTAVNYEYLPVQTVAKTGVRKVWMKSAGKGKERVTLMLLGDSSGVKYDPFVVFKTKPSTNAERAKENTAFQHGFGRTLWKELQSAQQGVQVYGNRAGWWNSELTIQFLLHHFLHRENIHKHILLLLDDFSGHWRWDIRIIARLLNVELMRIPPGYTFACQPADIAWNKPIKTKLRANWGRQMLEQLRAYAPGVGFKLKAPTRTELISWIKAAWSSLSTSTIVNGFYKAKLIPNRAPSTHVELTSVEETDTNWEELFDMISEFHLEQEMLQRSAVDPACDIDTLEVYKEDA